MENQDEGAAVDRAPSDDVVVRIEGVIERIVFESDESGFLVGRLQEKGCPELTTFVGHFVAVSPGDTVRMWGRWVDDKRFGRQLRAERYETVMPSTKAAIEKYLGSGLIDGIGPTYAKRLVAAFGVETLRVIQDNPERLRSVPGIGKKRVTMIREAWEKHQAVHSIMLFLQGHGISTSQAIKIYKRYGGAAVTVLRQNPYRLAEDIAGIAFRSADKIAAQLGMEKHAPQRCEAGLIYTLQQAGAEGHVFLPEKDLIAKAAELLEVAPDLLSNPLAALRERKAVICDGTVAHEGAVYLPAPHQAELGCERLIKRLLSAPAKETPIKVDKAIEWVETRHSIQLSEEQRHAIAMAAQSKVMVITGGPGTGKTTLVNSILAIFEAKGLKILLAAPTGRAAKRMQAATNHEAKTIHRLLEFSPKQNGFVRDENNPLSADLIVIDESSMIDIHLMHHLLKAVPARARLFLVGDVDQLPSVGPGNVLMDIIASNVVPVAWLKTVFRQAAESGIVANAHRINQGLYPEFNASDFFFVERPDPAKALETIVDLVTRRIPQKFAFDPMRDIQVLAPMHRGDAGVAGLNEALQQALNPRGEPVPRKTFRLGDKVMQLRNNYELDVFNGDVGIVTLIDTDVKEIRVEFDDRAVLYPFDDLDDLSLAYAATVHKAQGSEYPAVIIPMLTQHYLLLQRNVLYTAITRAAKLVLIVGDPKALRMAVRNARFTRRNTRLADRLRNSVTFRHTPDHE